MMRGIIRHKFNSVTGPGRVQRARHGSGVALLKGEGGFTLIEVVMTMLLLSVGLMSLGPLLIGVIRGNRFAQDLTLATSLAEDRIEEIMHQATYVDITEANFPDEAQGQIHSGDPRYSKYERSAAIVDSIDAFGRSMLKGVTVIVAWIGLGDRPHNVTLYGRVARF